jgi:hypothetical protein
MDDTLERMEEEGRALFQGTTWAGRTDENHEGPRSECVMCRLRFWL